MSEAYHKTAFALVLRILILLAVRKASLNWADHSKRLCSSFSSGYDLLICSSGHQATEASKFFNPIVVARTDPYHFGFARVDLQA